MAWKVEVSRIESIAEHVYGTLMLAIAIQSEYKPECSNDFVRELLKEEPSFSGAWIKFTESYANYDENFLAVAEYARENRIF